MQDKENTATAPSFDAFSGFYLEETSTLEIDLPNGEPMLYDGQRVVVHIYGPATDKHAAAVRAHQKEATTRLMAAAGNKAAKKQGEDDQADAKFLTAVTSHIDNFPYPGGVRAIYAEPRLQYIAKQVTGHLADLGNFFKG